MNLGFLLPKMGADVLLEHAAESWPQVMKSPVKRVDAVTQSMAAKWTYLQTEKLLFWCISGWDRKKKNITSVENKINLQNYIHVTLHFLMPVNKIIDIVCKNPAPFSVTRYTADECVSIVHTFSVTCEHWGSTGIETRWERLFAIELPLPVRYGELTPFLSDASGVCAVFAQTWFSMISSHNEELPVILSQETVSPDTWGFSK